MLRELEGRGITGHAGGGGAGGEAPAGRTIWPAAGSRAPADPEQGRRGASRVAPTWGQGGGEEWSGVPKENPAPSGILEKLSPMDTQPWMCGSREGGSETWRGCQGEGKTPRDHAGGRFLKEAAPGGRPWEGPPRERADSTTRPQGRQEAARPRGLQTKAGSHLSATARPRPPASVVAWAGGPGGHHTKTLARASAPALAMRALLGWQATAWMASSCFLRWAVIS